MQATIQDITEFSKLLDVIGTFDPQFNIKCSKEGIRFSCMDTAKTSVVTAVLPCEYFQSFSYTAPTGQIDLGVKSDVLKSLFKSATKKDILHLHKDDKSDYLTFQFDGADRQTKWDMKLMDITADELSIPDLDSNIRCSINTSCLSNWQKRYTGITGQALEFKPFPDKIVLQSSGDIGTVTSTLCSGDNFSINQYSSPKAVSLSPHSIRLASKIGDLSNECDIFWTNDAPVGVKAQFGNSASICMFYAPVMDDSSENEDDDQMDES